MCHQCGMVAPQRSLPGPVSGVCRRSPVVLAGAFLLWLLAVGAGMGALMVYSAKPTEQGEAIHQWPLESGLGRDPERYTLLMFLHPGCSCSLASLGELEMLLARSGGQVSTQIIFLHGHQLETGRTESALREAAGRLPGVRIWEDTTGQVAQAFGAGVSGDTLVFDPSGALRFHGGITAARAHSGNNAGRQAITTLAAGGQPGVVATPVFGCSLFSSLPAPPDRIPTSNAVN